MQKKIFCGVGLLIGLCVTALESRVTIKDRALYYTEQEVNGRRFSHRTELLEDGRKDVWKIDEESVDRDAYEEALLDAEKEEHRKALRKEYEDRSLEHNFKQNAQRMLIKKLLQNNLHELESEIKKLQAYGLAAYYNFSPATLESADDYAQLVQVFIPQTRALLSENPDAEPTYAQLLEQYSRITTVLDRVKAFARDTITRAIDQCNDTKRLKDLLDLVS